jgi:ACS family tartrate transporter-like MFS transporter
MTAVSQPAHAIGDLGERTLRKVRRLAAAGYLVQVSALLAMVALTIAAMGIYSAIAPFLAMPSTALVGAAAAAGLALVNSLGNLGGFLAPYAVGVLNDATGSNRSGLLFLAGCLAVTAVATYAYARRRPEGRLAETAQGEWET